jgi:hypothetical protein
VRAAGVADLGEGAGKGLELAGSAVASGIAAGDVPGRRERGSNAASPSASYRASRAQTQDLATPYLRATSLADRPSTVTTSRAFDIHAASRLRHPPGPGVLYVLRHPVLNVLRLDTTPSALRADSPADLRRQLAGIGAGRPIHLR